MSTGIKLCIICIFLSAPFSIDLHGQDSIFLKADELFRQNRYFESSIAFEEFIYNNKGNFALFSEARYRKAVCYRYLNRFDKALTELNSMALFRASDSLKTKVYYEKAINNYLTGNYKEGLFFLERLDETGLEGTQDYLTLKILVLNSMRSYEEARQTFIDLLNESNHSPDRQQYFLKQIDSLYMKKNLPVVYSHKKAKILSQFVPGVGQVYTGHPGEGAISFLLNAALLGFGIHQLYYGFYFTAYIAGFSIFHKTYSGGMQRAKYLADLETDNKMMNFNQSAISIIRHITHK
jgi:tetratricopeptide (TPR) repeat protein